MIILIYAKHYEDRFCNYVGSRWESVWNIQLRGNAGSKIILIII